MKAKWIIPNTWISNNSDADIERETKRFSWFHLNNMHPLLLGDLPDLSERAASWTVCLGKAVRGRTSVFPRTIIPFLGSHHAAEAEWMFSLQPWWVGHIPLHSGIGEPPQRRTADMKAEQWALPSPARYLIRGNTGLINWKIKVIVKAN